MSDAASNYAQSCPAGGQRPLTGGEVALARSIFGDAIAYDRVTIKRRKFFPFQPRNVVMAPRGHLHFHPDGSHYCENFAVVTLDRQGLFIHEMTHVWQAQLKGEWYLVLRRHPFCRYDYSLKPGWPLRRYGLEQQAEIIRHAFLLRNGGKVAGAGSAKAYEILVNFPGAPVPDAPVPDVPVPDAPVNAA